MSWALQVSGWPARRWSWRSRATTTRSRTAAEDGAIWLAQRLGGRALDAHQDVDAVQQRAGEAAAVAREVGLRALAARAAEAARARVRGGDEHEARREDHDLLAADDRHVAVLERLPQRLEARARELRQLVEEEHAAVRERRLAGLRRVGAADEARRRRSCGAARGTGAR